MFAFFFICRICTQVFICTSKYVSLHLRLWRSVINDNGNHMFSIKWHIFLREFIFYIWVMTIDEVEQYIYKFTYENIVSWSKRVVFIIYIHAFANFLIFRLWIQIHNRMHFILNIGRWDPTKGLIIFKRVVT